MNQKIISKTLVKISQTTFKIICYLDMYGNILANKPVLVNAIFQKLNSMEYDCHIFSKYPVFQMKNLVFQSKYLVFRFRNFEILGFSHLKFEILGISSEIPSISKTWNFD